MTRIRWAHVPWLTLSLAMVASPAWSIFDAQLMAGKRWAEVKADSNTDAVSGTEVQASVHIDPIPLVPVGFGIFASGLTYNETPSGYVHSELTGLSVGPEVTAWLPLPAVPIEPFVKVGYTVFGSIVGEGTSTPEGSTTELEYKTAYDISGFHLRAGAKWSPIPLVAAFIQVDLSQEKLTVKKYEVSGVEVDLGGEDPEFPSRAVLLGVEVGL